AQALRDDPPKDGPDSLDVDHISGDVQSTFPNGCHVAEVEVDPDTGTVEIGHLTLSPVSEQCHGVGIDGHVAATRLGLQPRELEAVPDSGQRLGDLDPPGVEMDVIPAEPEQFTASHPGRGGESKQHRMAVVSGFSEELVEFDGRPRGSTPAV
ncbi:MAG: molybdopterin-dependent oxidoreductase, partial [Actinobacteria bacterium]|nr:molybdopterin-dependent oxidoreductase [Actinomycetota bacterium]